MDIIFSINNNESVKVIPVPAEIKIENPFEHATFDGLKGPLAIIGERGLRSFSLSSYFPIRKTTAIRPGADADAVGYVEWFEESRDRKLPMRVIIVYDNGLKINMACLIADFTHWVQRNGDIGYEMQVIEYVFPEVRQAEDKKEEETSEEDEDVKWSEFEKSEEYALLQRLVRRAKADSASTDGFTTDLEKAIAAGITTGDYPQDVATREQVASMIVRAHNL